MTLRRENKIPGEKSDDESGSRTLHTSAAYSTRGVIGGRYALLKSISNCCARLHQKRAAA
jgi:hypothetical protein